jgi:hypothetical protein
MIISPLLARYARGKLDAWFSSTPQQLIGNPQRGIVLDRVGFDDSRHIGRRFL